MTGALRLVSVERGHDPRRFALVAFGGAGPLHANALGGADGLVPGHRAADARRPLLRSATSSRPAAARSRRRSSGASTSSRGPVPTEASADADALARGEGSRGRAGASTTSTSATTSRRSRSRSRSSRRVGRLDLAEVAERFPQLHEREYGFRLDAVCELVTLRVEPRSATTPAEVEPRACDASRRRRPGRSGSTAAANGTRRRCTTARRSRPATASTGPAIVVQTDSTTLVLPGSRPRSTRPQPRHRHGSRAPVEPRRGGVADRDRHRRERAQEHPPRDGRGHLPGRDVDGDPGGARLVPAARRRRGPHARRPVRLAARRVLRSSGRRRSSSPATC